MDLGYFKPQELLPKEIYDVYEGLGMRFLNPKIVEVLNFLREEYKKPITVNNWYWGGNRNESTLRIKGHKHYKQYSCHSWGNAVDFVVKGVKAPTVQDTILNCWYDDLITLGYCMCVCV